jgi:hypothetical protein
LSFTCCCLQVLLSVAVVSVQGFLQNAVGYVVLSMVLAAAVCLAVGLLVAPSLATDEVCSTAAQQHSPAQHSSTAQQCKHSNGTADGNCTGY